MPPYKFFGDGFVSKHRCYCSSHSPLPSSVSSSSSPRCTPPKPPQPRRPRSPYTAASLPYPATRHGVRLEERVPRSERILSCFERNLVAGPFEALGGKWRIDWFEQAAEQAARRPSVSTEADSTHRELLADIVRGYKEGRVAACSEAYVWGAEDTLQEMQQGWNRGGASTSASRPKTDEIDFFLVSRRLAMAGKSRDKRSGWKSIRLEVAREIDSETGPWQKGTSWRDAEKKPVLELLKTIHGTGTGEIEIRLRGRPGEQKTWIRRKTGREEKPMRKQSRLLGDYGGVNGVEW